LLLDGLGAVIAASSNSTTSHQIAIGVWHGSFEVGFRSGLDENDGVSQVVLRRTVSPLVVEGLRTVGRWK
jgi:hypothetical protein